MKTNKIYDKGFRNRFFAQYWGTQTFCGGDNHIVSEVEWYTISDKSYLVPHLRLKSIADITDEEAIEFIRLGSDVFKKCEITKRHPLGLSFSFEYETSKQRRIKSYHINYIQVESLNTKQIDYLRSKGYALPFMEHSIDDLIDLGYVRLIQKQ